MVECLSQEEVYRIISYASVDRLKVLVKDCREVKTDI